MGSNSLIERERRNAECWQEEAERVGLNKLTVEK